VAADTQDPLARPVRLVTLVHDSLTVSVHESVVAVHGDLSHKACDQLRWEQAIPSTVVWLETLLRRQFNLTDEIIRDGYTKDQLRELARKTLSCS
jgi:hypothetical protein